MAETDDNKLKRLNYQSCFATDAGKKVLDDLEKECRYKRDLFNKDSARITDFNLGANWVIRYIHSWLDRKPEEKKQETAKHETVI
jgi:uncharacterized protein YfeS